MKNTDKTKEIEFSAGSYPSFICVYPVNLWFDCSKLLLKRTVLGQPPVRPCRPFSGEVPRHGILAVLRWEHGEINHGF